MSAVAADLPTAKATPTFVAAAQSPWMIRVRALGVLPDASAQFNVNGVPLNGASATITDTLVPELDITYFFTPNLAVNVIAATSRHDVSVQNSAIGNVELGRVWALPPTVTLQYHPLPASRFSPYLGLGVNYTIFYGEGGSRSAPVTHVDVENSWGVAANIGVDYEVTPNWLLNLDVKRIMMRPDVSVNHGAIRGETELDPWVVGVAVRYRF